MITRTEQIQTRGYRITNALVSLHEYDSGTAILQITGTRQDMHIAVWMSPEELRALSKAFLDFADGVEK